jgi:hypothetical protein
MVYFGHPLEQGAFVELLVKRLSSTMFIYSCLCTMDKINPCCGQSFKKNTSFTVKHIIA